MIEVVAQSENLSKEPPQMPVALKKELMSKEYCNFFNMKSYWILVIILDRHLYLYGKYKEKQNYFNSFKRR